LEVTLEVHDPNALLASLCELPREKNWVEFKVGTFNPDTVGKYVSGLANSAMLDRQKAAYMVWGVKDGTHEIVGTPIRIESEKVGSESFLSWLTKCLRPKLNITFHQVRVGEKVVEMLCIDPGYTQPVSFNGQSYIRVDTNLNPLKEHTEKERALWQITSSYSFENATISPHMAAEEIFRRFDVEGMLTLLKVTDRTPQNMIECLEQRHLITGNMQGGYAISALLAMACAKDLDEFPLLENKGPRVITYKGADKLSATSDVEGRQGYLVKFSNLLGHIVGKIPSEEKLLHGIRTIEHQIPEAALREFVANALIHQDFTTHGSRPLIEIYRDRVRIINPGTPLIDVERFIDGGTQSRNPNFARLMRHAGLCEERGSGVDRAVKAIEKAALPPPLFGTAEGATSVTVFMPRRFANMTPDERIRACFQHAQVCLESNEPMNNSSLRARFGLSDKQISQVSLVIRDALDAGKIKPLNEDQGNRNARYVPVYA
jgi:ATP-dependent DNA helicase RecG